MEREIIGPVNFCNNKADNILRMSRTVLDFRSYIEFVNNDVRLVFRFEIHKHIDFNQYHY